MLRAAFVGFFVPFAAERREEYIYLQKRAAEDE